MFMGSYDHSLDAKGRMIIPSKFREALGEKFVITRSPDPCLCIYDYPSWERFVQKLTQLPYNTREQRQLVRFFMSNACEVEPDRQGRVLIPQKLREHAHIEKNVVLMGVGARIEVWDPDTFDYIVVDEATKKIVKDFYNKLTKLVAETDGYCV